MPASPGGDQATPRALPLRPITVSRRFGEICRTPVPCARCGRPLQAYYFEVNGTIAREACGHAIEAESTAGFGAGRGGWRYQALAMLLTCVAMAGICTPPIARAARAGAAQAVVTESSTDPAPPSGSAAIVASAIAAPFVAGFQNIIGVIIIGIGLYEAWKLNTRTTMTITGPRALAAASRCERGPWPGMQRPELLR